LQSLPLATIGLIILFALLALLTAAPEQGGLFDLTTLTLGALIGSYVLIVFRPVRVSYFAHQRWLNPLNSLWDFSRILTEDLSIKSTFNRSNASLLPETLVNKEADHCH
jgi:hypothetical protein